MTDTSQDKFQHHRRATAPSRTADKFVLRLPDGMRDRIAQIASANHRSMNSELVTRLTDSLNGVEPSTAVEGATDTSVWIPAEGMLVTVNGMEGIFTIRGFFLNEGLIMVRLDTLPEYGYSCEQRSAGLLDLNPIQLR